MKLSKLRAHTSTRMVAGQSVPRQNTTSFGMRHAMKVGGSKYAGDSGEVEGAAARPRLDRPGRARGGRVCKADGGWTGEGDSGKPMKEKAAEERAKGLADGSKGILPFALGPTVAMGSLGPGKGRFIAKALGTLAGARGAGKLAQGYSHELESKRLSREGDEAEGRKSGGRVMDKDDDCYASGGFLKIRHPGALRKSLDVPDGEKIPAKKLERAEHSDNPKLRKRAILAQTMKSWKK